MPTDIVIPALGESITSGVIATWRKKDGERVERDETLLELETDKITLELPSPAAGVLTRRAAEGDTVDVGSIVGVIEEKPGAAGAAAASAPAATPAPKPVASEPRAQASGSPPPAPPRTQPTAPVAAPARATPSEPGAAATGATTPAPQRTAQAAPEVRATPLARKVAEDKGVDISRITPTGPGGRVSEHDVLAASSGAVAPVAAAPGSEGARATTPAPTASPRATSRERVSPLRAKIAARLVEAQHTAAMLTTFNECDMSAVMDLRARHKEAFEKKHGVGLGFMSFFVKACVSALEAYPLVNAQLAEDSEGRLEVVKHHYCDIAVAVGTPKGLTVPVLRNCETRSFAQVESGIKDLATRARDGKLTLDELQGGTFTITNGGIYGSMMSTPILNPPQSAILGMHNIVRRPVENPAKVGSGEVVVRPMMYLALSYDHRIIDGAEAVSFLVHIKKAIENPERLLLGV